MLKINATKKNTVLDPCSKQVLFVWDSGAGVETTNEKINTNKREQMKKKITIKNETYFCFV